MFLNESYNSGVVVEGASANPEYMYECIMEANDMYHDLCMQMIKCEHTAIVSENTKMLNEGIDEFKAKAKKIASDLWKRFNAFIDRVKAEWSKLVAGVISKTVNQESFEKATKGVESFNVKASVGKISEKIEKVEKLFKYMVNNYNAKFYNSNITQMNAEVKADNEISSLAKDLDALAADEAEVPVDKEAVKRAFNFLKVRPKMIKELEAVRSNGRKALQEDLKDEKNKEAKSAKSLNIALYSSAVSKAISKVNRVTVDCVKLINACKKAHKKAKAEEDKKLSD